MRLSESELKAAYQERTSPRQSLRTGCATAEELWDLASGEVSGALRERLTVHLAACSECARELQGLRSVAPVHPVLPERTQTTRAFLRFISAPPALRLAASLGCVALAVVFLVLSRPATRLPGGAEPGERGTDVRGAAVSPPDSAVLSVPPDRFRWVSVPDARDYQIVVYDSESMVIWRSPWLPGTEAEVPSEVSQRLNAGRSYSWRVTARAGIERVESSLFQFTLQPTRTPGQE